MMNPRLHVLRLLAKIANFYGLALMKFVDVEGTKKLVLCLVACVVKIYGHVGCGQALLALQFDAAFGTPGKESARKNIDVVGVKRRGDHHRHSLHHSWVRLKPGRV